MLIGVAPYITTPAYNAYLGAFMLLLISKLPSFPYWVGNQFYLKSSHVVVIVWFMVTLTVTAASDSALRDIFRDFGVLLAFLIGRYTLLSVETQRPQRLLESLSLVGVLVSLGTLAGALSAYAAGVGAYHWRANYVPPFHAWLPFFLAINVALAQLQPLHRLRYIVLALLCVLASFASISRTDILLVTFFGLSLLIKYRHLLLCNKQAFVMFLFFVAMLPPLLAIFSTLEVVQERIGLGIGEDDQSVGWRLIENSSLFEYFLQSESYRILTGFGWGARVPLHSGIYDFNGNDSIPHLHNSLLTYMLKFGCVGMLIFLMYVVGLLYRWRRCRQEPLAPLAFAGGWIVLFVLGKSVSLQGLTEWALVMFFGLGCGLIMQASRRFTMNFFPVHTRGQPGSA